MTVISGGFSGSIYIAPVSGLPGYLRATYLPDQSNGQHVTFNFGNLQFP